MHNAAHSGPPSTSATLRILDEGATSLVVAARDAGLTDDAQPSLKTLLRAATTGRLEALKVCGRWLTSAGAIRRWVARQQDQRRAPQRGSAE
jgi:hypothetical protein